MTNVLVLGGGAQGRVIAGDLAAAQPGAQITVADLRRPALPGLPNLLSVEADLSDAAAIARLLHGRDLAVGALPSRYGFGAMRAAIDARVPLVDVSFTPEDALTLDDDARRAGIAILPDCGLAPGLSHLIAGHIAAERGTPESIEILVGGVARDPSRPYGYVVTWSLDDLLEEYTRPARIVRDGAPASVPVFSGYERLDIEGAGVMEAFLSDGLRTLIETLPGVREMAEKTLRWPGHVEAVRPLLAAGRLIDELRAKCSSAPPDDLVVLLVRVRSRDRRERVRLIDRFDAATGLTAMARTTALTTSAVAQMVMSGLVPPPGVQPLERAARTPGVFEFVRGALARRGVKLGAPEPEPATA